MLIALLIALLFGAGGPEAMFLIPDMEDRIIANITDVERQGQVLALLEQASLDIKEFSKKLETNGADLMKEQRDRTVGSRALQASFEELFLVRQEFQFRMVDRDTEIRNALSDEEFNDIVVEGLRSTSAHSTADSVHVLKKEQELANMLAHIREGVDVGIADPGMRSRALAAFDAFHAHMNDLIAKDPPGSELSAIYSRRDVPRTELEATYAEMDRYRSEMFDHFIDMREEIIRVTTPKEWTQVSNKLNLVFK